jgi:acetyl-CoA carboxylase alpha subunit
MASQAILKKETLDLQIPIINLLTDKFIELHGDRTQGDDKSVCGGLAWIEGKKLILISHRALTDYSSESIEKQTGLRKITRLLNIAKQLKHPVLIMESEMQRAAQPEGILTFNLIDAIIQNVRIMSYLPVPIIELLSGNPTMIDIIALALADCIIAPHSFEVLIREVLNLEPKTEDGFISVNHIVNSDKTNKPESSEISELINTVFIDNVQIIPALRQVLPSKIDELMSISVNDLISRRIDRIQRLSYLS